MVTTHWLILMETEGSLKVIKHDCMKYFPITGVLCVCVSNLKVKVQRVLCVHL